MKFSTIQITLSVVAGASCISVRDSAAESLVVEEAPQHLRPYILPNLSGQAVQLGNQIYRFSVTGNSSDGAFTLLQTNAPSSSSLGVLPHIHKQHYENFYCSKGRFQLWAETEDAEQQTRVLTQGDYGAVPHYTTHTFQILDPDTQMTGVIQPGGFEALFIAIAQAPYSSPIGAPFIPFNPPASNDTGGVGGLEPFDVFAKTEFSPRQDAVNGIAGSGDWHNGTNALAADSSTPNFIAKNYGPKYLHSENGVYSIIAPLVTAEQSEGNFTMGTITMSPLLHNMTAAPRVLTEPTAFQMEEGELIVEVEGYKKPQGLIGGDVLFVPAGTKLTYYASRPFTKFLYVSGGADGLASELIRDSQEWEFASYPQYSA